MPSYNQKYDRVALLADYHAGAKPSELATKYEAPLRTVYAIIRDERWAKLAVCDKCGEPATNGVNDLIEIPTTLGWREYKLFGHARYGCDKHYTDLSRKWSARLTADGVEFEMMNSGCGYPYYDLNMELGRVLNRRLEALLVDGRIVVESDV